MKTIFALAFTLIFTPLYGQLNMLGNTYRHILDRFNSDPEYEVKVDTMDLHTLLITCKTMLNYPYYTYEIDTEKDECVSFGTVSKNIAVLDAYLEMLSVVGVLENEDSLKQNSVFRVAAPDLGTLYYSVKHYARTDSLKRNLFYILVTKDKK